MVVNAETTEEEEKKKVMILKSPGYNLYVCKHFVINRLDYKYD